MPLTFIQRLSITGDAREKWYRTLAALLREGHNIFEVLEQMAVEFARIRHPLLPIVQEAMARMKGGGTNLRREAAERRTFGKVLLDLVPDNEAMLIDAGESAGVLHNGCQRAADYLASMKRLNSEVTGPLKEPFFLFALLLGVLVFFSLQVLPAFSLMAPRPVWPKYSQWYGVIADMAVPIAIVSIGIVVGVGAWILWASGNWTNPLRYSFDKAVWPFTLIANTNSASMLTSLAGFVAAGVPFGSAVQRLGAAANPYMKQVYANLGQELRLGRSAHEAITAVHIVPTSQHWLIRLYGRSTDFSGAMERVAAETIEVAISRTRATFGVINLLLKILVAFFIIWSLGSMFGVVDAVRKNSQVRVGAAQEAVTHVPVAAIPRTGQATVFVAFVESNPCQPGEQA